MTSSEIIETAKHYLLPTYTRLDFVIERGEGVFLYDTSAKEYLDFVSGIAVNALGYGDLGILKALTDQAGKLWHSSNLYYNEPQVSLAQLLVKNTFADKVFFCNSGTEAIEGAIKFARKWGRKTKSERRFEIIAFHNSFHGRTLGALSVTGQPEFWQDFQPLLPGIRFAEFNNFTSVEKLISNDTCAILIEPIQGESGVFPADREFLQALKNVCQEKKILLIYDEIQCGLGRTGTFCAYEQSGAEPDMMTLAKPLAAGLPLGAILAKDSIAAHIEPGQHASTFGGGPLVTAVAEHVVRRLLNPGLLAHVRETGAYLYSQLQRLMTRFSMITAVRGRGLMAGVSLADDPKKIIAACADAGLLVCKAGANTVRFLPPLIVEKEHIDKAMDIFAAVLQCIKDCDSLTK
jgi:acetylornithine/N-succinyldiaminopimelate aminotransferase